VLAAMNTDNKLRLDTMKYYILIFAFLLCFYPSWSQKKIQTTSLTPKLDSVLNQAYKVFELPGYAIGIIKSNKIIYAEGFGVKEMGKQSPIDSKSLFHMASVSKPFTATAIMQLVDKGKIQLDSPLTDYIPYFKMKDDRYKKITIKQMLTHTSGFPDVQNYHWDKPEFDDKALERYIKDSISTYELLFEPGTEFYYSNMAYDVLADVISKVSEMPFEAYMDKYIFKPCGMNNSTFLLKSVQSGNATSPHIFGDKCTFHVSPVYPYNRCHAASSTLHSNVEDMMKWAGMILNNGHVGGKQIISKESLKMMLSVQYKFDDESSMGYGWFNDTRNGKKIINHGGSDIGYQTYIGIIPQDSVAIVVMSNLFSFVPDGAITNLALNTIYNEPIWKLSKPINLAIGPMICKNGFAKAREKYFELKKNNAVDYDFSEEWLDKLGYALKDLGKLDDAINVLKLNAEAYPESVNCFDSLGELYTLNGQLDKAKESYRAALKLDPNCERCFRKLKKIEQP
jgi:CubicO group peptidase (beta-lactamase class C family)